MSRILTALYNGDIHPAEDYVMISSEYKRQDEAFMRDGDAFSGKLQKDLAEEYERLIDVHTDLFAVREADAYTRGMKLSARLALELLGDDAGHR